MSGRGAQDIQNGGSQVSRVDINAGHVDVVINSWQYFDLVLEEAALHFVTTQ